ncbi:MAG: methyltransferase domain-containing protein [Chloroflexi bacterium]|nr:MAG: methyltransferase domain-containing protein [Chloroflexota bacterium]
MSSIYLNLPYLIPRLVRHFLPEKMVRALLLRSLIIRPGLETSNPSAAVQRYADVLSARGRSFNGKRVLVFGYGGRFDTGFGLLKQGAAHVILCDRYAPADESHNRRMFAAEEKYFFMENENLRPRPEWMTLLESDIRQTRSSPEVEPVDIVVSSSVYEHLDDVEGITRALAGLTKPDGIQIHFVDLRDHFFKNPFEMLRFSENTWRRWLNPSSNHNRYRLWDYRRAFQACFADVEIEVLAHEREAFRKVAPYIRPEFVSGDLEEDAVTLIRVIASQPRE